VRFDDVPVLFRAAESLRHRVVFITIKSVEEAPVDSVEVKMNVFLEIGWAIHRKLQTAGKLVSNIERFIT
jgi:hypothetical protein